jgi:acetate kinase
MGTRSGDIDPTVVFHLHRVAGLSLDEIDDALNKRGGLRGLCGDSDMREVLRRRAAGNEAAALAFDVYCHRLRGYVGAYYALLGTVDAVTFTAGVGENAPAVRAAALAGLDRLGIVVDATRNHAHAKGERVISADGAEVTICVIPTDEELDIAEQARHVITAGPTPATP